MRGTKHFPRHSERKTDVLAGWEGQVKGEENATGGDVARDCWNVAVAGGQQDRQREGKAYGTTNFLMFDAVTCAIPGGKTAEQIADNCAASELPPLSDASMKRVADIYAERIAPLVHQRW